MYSIVFYGDVANTDAVNKTKMGDHLDVFNGTAPSGVLS
jgi:hypothetical protein